MNPIALYIINMNIYIDDDDDDDDGIRPRSPLIPSDDEPQYKNDHHH